MSPNLWLPSPPPYLIRTSAELCMSFTVSHAGLIHEHISLFVSFVSDLVQAEQMLRVWCAGG